MRIEEVVSRYGRQEYGRYAPKKGAFKTTAGSRGDSQGCYDMLSLSLDIIDPGNEFADLVAFTRMIPGETAKEWVRAALYRDGFQDDGLIDKLIMEIL